MKKKAKRTKRTNTTKKELVNRERKRKGKAKRTKKKCEKKRWRPQNEK